MSIHTLVGIETDNLLGFLALLGVLQALDVERPEWFARAYFTGVPLRATLVTETETNDVQIAETAAAACSRLASCFSVGAHADLKFPQREARKLLEDFRDVDINGMLLSALCSDAAVRDDETIEPTPLCTMFGQGHQHFLDRLRNVAQGTLPRVLRASKNRPNLNAVEKIRDALFAPWARADATESFRWDFQEDRRYALRAINPSDDPATTEHGANRLALLGLLTYQCVPTLRGSKVRLAIRGVGRLSSGRVHITWPIWTRPATLKAIQAMLDEPALVEEKPDFAVLSRLSIVEARRVRRISVDKFINFSRAEAMSG